MSLAGVPIYTNLVSNDRTHEAQEQEIMEMFAYTLRATMAQYMES